MLYNVETYFCSPYRILNWLQNVSIVNSIEIQIKNVTTLYFMEKKVWYYIIMLLGVLV